MKPSKKAAQPIQHEPPPECLDAEARAKWAEILPILEARGEIDRGALDALTLYCRAWGLWREAEEKVRELGPIVKSPSGFPVENPYLTVARKAQSELRRWAGELKLTPRSSDKKGKLPTATADEPPVKPNPLQGLRIHA